MRIGGDRVAGWLTRVDEADFDAVLHEYAGLLGRIAASYEADPALRDDLLQDIAVALWRALPRFRGDASLKTFVARVAHNRSVTHVLQESRRTPTPAELDDCPDPAPGPELRAQDRERHERLANAVRALPLGQKQAVTLALEGFSQQEIGVTLGISTNNVAVRLNRARKALRAALGEFV